MTTSASLSRLDLVTLLLFILLLKLLFILSNDNTKIYFRTIAAHYEYQRTMIQVNLQYYRSNKKYYQMFLDSQTTEKSDCKPSHRPSLSDFHRYQNIIETLRNEIHELRISENNLRRVNHTLMNVIQSNQSNPYKAEANINIEIAKFKQNQKKFKVQMQQALSKLEAQWREKYLRQCQVNEELRFRLEMTEKQLGKRQLQSSRTSTDKPLKSQRKESIKNMQNLMDNIMKEKLKVNQRDTSFRTADKENIMLSHRGSEKCNSIKKFEIYENPRTFRRKGEDDVSNLVLSLMHDKIDNQMKLKQIENELQNRNLKTKERDLLQTALKNMKKKVKDDQYQQYLKHKICKQLVENVSKELIYPKKNKIF